LIRKSSQEHHAFNFFQKLQALALVIAIIFLVYLFLRAWWAIRSCYRSRRSIDLQQVPGYLQEVPGIDDNQRGCWRKTRVFRSPARSPQPAGAPAGIPSAPGCPGLMPLGPSPGMTPGPSPCPSYQSAIQAPAVSPYYLELLDQLANQSETDLNKIINSIQDQSRPSRRVPPRTSTANELARDMEAMMDDMSSQEPVPILNFPQTPICPSPPGPEEASPPKRPRSQPEGLASCTANAVMDAAGPSQPAANPVPASLARMRKLLPSHL